MTHTHAPSLVPLPPRPVRDRYCEVDTLPFMSNEGLLRAAFLFDTSPSESASPALTKPHAVIQAERLVRLKVGGRAAPALAMPPIPSWEEERFADEARAEALGVENTPTRPAPSLASMPIMAPPAVAAPPVVGASAGQPVAQPSQRPKARRRKPLLVAVAVSLQAGLLVLGQAVYPSEFEPVANGEVLLVVSPPVSHSAGDLPSAEDAAAASEEVEPRADETVVNARPVVATLTPTAPMRAVSEPIRIKAQWPKDGEPRRVRIRRPVSLYPLDI